MTTILYRHYDANGTLLYVGITDDLLARSQAHSRTSWWWPLVARVEYRVFPDRAAASRAEVHAIEREHPLHNQRRRLRKSKHPVPSLRTQMREKAPRQTEEISNP